MLLKKHYITHADYGYIQPNKGFCDRQYGKAMTLSEAAIFWRLPESDRDAYKRKIKKGKYSSSYNPK